MADARLRELERRAAAGDEGAQEQLRAARARAGAGAGAHVLERDGPPGGRPWRVESRGTLHAKPRYAPLWRCTCGWRGTVRPRRDPSPTCPRARVASEDLHGVGLVPRPTDASDPAGGPGHVLGPPA